MEENVIGMRTLTRNDSDFQGKKVRVVREGMEPVIAMYNSALDMAENQDLDLVLVAENADLPVVKILDYSKEIYRRKKQEKKQTQIKTKEIKFGMSIESHDYNIKINQAKKFLKKGMRVRLTVVMKGWREAQNEDLAKDMLRDAIEALSDEGHPEAGIKNSNRSVGVVLVSK
jgi:translation initiation factor IF-3